MTDFTMEREYGTIEFPLLGKVALMPNEKKAAGRPATKTVSPAVERKTPFEFETTASPYAGPLNVTSQSQLVRTTRVSSTSKWTRA